jgi:hypothetical protein
VQSLAFGNAPPPPPPQGPLPYMKQGGVSHSVAFAIYIKKCILRRQKKKNYGNSNIISPCQNYIIFKKKKKSSKKQTKIFEDIIITL